MLRLEKALDECLDHLKMRCSALYGDTDLSDTDDLDSIASGRDSINTFGVRKSVVRFAGHHREVERLTDKVSKLERENRTLRQEVIELKVLLGHDDEEEKKTEEKEEAPKLSPEGAVLELLRRLDGGTPADKNDSL